MSREIEIDRCSIRMFEREVKKETRDKEGEKRDKERERDVRMKGWV